MEFKLHPQLKKDLTLLASLDLCDIFLLPNSSNPWTVLVPRVPEIKELHQLNFEDQKKLLQEINKVSVILEKEFTPDKINIASFGNMVPQLHIHIIARYKNDKAWPGSIFGVNLKKDLEKVSHFTNQMLKNFP